MYNNNHYSFENHDCKGFYTVSEDGSHVTISIELVNADEKVAQFIAPAPPTRNASFSGSGLPYANGQMAFEGTPSKGTVTLDEQNRGTFVIKTPNSYYAALGTVLLPPTVYVTYKYTGKSVVTAIKLDVSIPYRSLTYSQKRTGADLYDNFIGLPVRSQEQILRDSAYPSGHDEHDNFWGLKPAV